MPAKEFTWIHLPVKQTPRVVESASQVNAPSGTSTVIAAKEFGAESTSLNRMYRRWLWRGISKGTIFLLKIYD